MSVGGGQRIPTATHWIGEDGFRTCNQRWSW